MAYGICRKCKREVTAGSERCALCGEPLPVIHTAHPTLRLEAPPGRPRTPAAQGIGTGETESRPELQDDQSQAAKTEPVLQPLPDPRVTLSMAEITEAAILRQTSPPYHRSLLAGLEDSAPRTVPPQTLGKADDQGAPSGQKEERDSFDMRRLLGETTLTWSQSAQESIKSPTVELPTISRALYETDIEGHRAIRTERRKSTASGMQRRQNWARTLPLLVIVALALVGLALAAKHLAPSSTDPRGGQELETATVNLAPGSYIVGLTEENKETVLQACFRLSDNPNHECRRAYLTDIGEFPSSLQDFPAFRIDRFEVSNARFESCVESGACPARDIDSCQFHTHRGYQLNTRVPDRMFRQDMPAICVTRQEAETFCHWAGGRLPSPAEWERAARGGDDRLAPWGSLWAPNLLNWAESDMGGFPVVGRLDGYELSAPVDHYSDGTTLDGIFNMLGNVAEWVAASPRLADGTRGGSYRDDLTDLRITYQRPLRPESRRSDVGFRCLYPAED